MSYREEIKEEEAKLALLKKKQANFDKLAPSHRLAVELHGLLCRWDHTEGCSWFYEISSDETHDWTRYAHAHALKQAEAALAVNPNVDTILAIVKAVKSI